MKIMRYIKFYDMTDKKNTENDKSDQIPDW